MSNTYSDDKQPYRKYFDSYVDSIEDNLQKLKSNYPTDFDKVVELILNSKGRLIFSGIGKSGQIAKKISSSIASTGTHAFFVHPSEAVHGDLGMIYKDDIVFAISNSGNTKELRGIVDYCKNLNINIISITSNTNSYLAKNSTYSLFIPKVDEFSNLGSPCNSVILTLVIGDALMIALHNEKKFSKEEYKLLHPSGSLGKSMTRVSDIMLKVKNIAVGHLGSDITDILICMSSKKLDFCVILDLNKKLIGVVEVEKIKQKINDKSTENKIKEDIDNNIIDYDVETINYGVLICDNIDYLICGKEKNIVVIDEKRIVVGVLTKEIIAKVLEEYTIV